MSNSTVSYNSVATNGEAFDFAADGDQCTVVTAGFAGSALGAGVLSAHLANRLINNGYVSGYTYGVVYYGAFSDTVNNAGGFIVGHTGIDIDAASSIVNNSGEIIGLTNEGVLFDTKANDFSLYNRGEISARGSAVEVDTFLSGGTIVNNGRISSGGVPGVLLNNAHAVTVSVDNTAAGSISGPTGSIVNIGQGALSLQNSGSLFGDVVCAGARDVVVSRGHIHGAVHLGGGDDSFIGFGGTSGAVYGEAGNDRIMGGKAGDHLFGDFGNDTLTGGPGKDHFVFDTGLSPTANVDRITDFKHGIDKVDLSHAVFAAVNPAGVLHGGMFYTGHAAHKAGDRIIYNPANGWLSYDADGNHAGGALHFATLGAHLALTSSDFIVVA